MSDKLEALSQPAAYEVKGCLCHTIEEAEIYVGQPESLYSQEYVTALLAALEEKDQRIKDLEGDVRFERLRLNEAEIAALIKRADAAEKEVKQWHDVATAAAQDDADWHKLTDRKNDLICKLVDAGIAQITRANAAEQREEHLKASVDVLSAKNAELEQRLQQPIKLPGALIPALHTSGEPFMRPEPFGFYLNRDDVIKALNAAGHKVEGE